MLNIPIRISRKEICYLLHEQRRGAFVTPQGRVRYDLLKKVFDETGLNKKVVRLGNVYSVEDSKIIIDTLKLLAA